MTRWREVKLGDICTSIQYGYTESATFDPVGPKFLRITDIVPNIIDWSTVPYCKIDKENYEKYKLDVGDIVIARTGATTGYNKRIKDSINAVFASYLIRFKINKEIADDCFISYVLKSDSYFGFIDNAVGGSAQPGINARVLSQFSFLLPPLPEQKAIADVLSSLDDKIDLLTRQNKTLEDLAQAYFRKWFIEDASDEWEVGKAKDYFEIGIGKTPPRKEEHWFSKNNNDVVWVSISDMGKAGMFIGDSSEYLTKDAVKQFNIKRVPKGAIILSFKLTVGRVAIALRDFTTNEAIAHFIYRNLYEREYLYFYLKTFDYYSLGSTSSIATAVNSKIIKDMPFVMPDVETLKKYHKIAAPMFSKIESNTNQILTLQKIRDTLLPKLISGEIRVKM